MLLALMATNKVEKLARTTGLTIPQPIVEKGRVQEELRVQLSLCSLQASMACMLYRCHQIGDTAALCTGWRDVARQVERASWQIHL